MQQQRAAAIATCQILARREYEEQTAKRQKKVAELPNY
jgi:hypothetical protein